MTARAILLALLCGGAAAAAGCSTADGPVAGELEVRISSPHFDDRALLLKVSGRQTAVTAPAGSGYRVLVAPGLGDTARVVVLAPQGSRLVTGALLRLTVPDTRQAASYGVRVLDAASVAYLQRSTSGYVVSVVKP